MLAASIELQIPIEWGGNWKMRDGPHWQLPWKDYP
jgi:peptidoglycan L-alanyl-D-glutamate endopeptidase CwlK